MSMLNERLIPLLACPMHQGAKLRYEKKDSFFLCDQCARKFEIFKRGGVDIPNFLMRDHNLVNSEKPVGNKLLKTLQGQPFARKNDENKWILDLGCGQNPRGTINLDCFVPEQIPQNFILADAEFLPFRENSVDQVVSHYSIEHMLHPAHFIENIYRIAREKVEIVTDNSEWLGDAFFRLAGTGRIFNPEHCYKWSVEYFENLLKKMGFARFRVYLTNLSTSWPVRCAAVLGKIPRVGNFFYRDLIVEIWKD